MFKNWFPRQLRQLFVHIIINCQMCDVGMLWRSHVEVMTDDILFEKRKTTDNPLSL